MTTNVVQDKPVKLGRFMVTSELEDWEIVHEVGNARWLGRVIQDPASDKHPRVLTLQPALELSSPSRTPVLVADGRGGRDVGVAGGLDAAYVMNQPSDHPVREIAYSSRQKCSEMSEDLRIYLFHVIVDAVKRHE